MNDYEKLSLEILRSTPAGAAMLADRPASPERRRFLQMLSGGLLIGVTLNTSLLRADAEEAATVGPRRPRNELPKDFNAFLHIAEDGKITGYTGKIEMGQGINTSLAQMLAEELDAPYDTVRMVAGDTDLCPWDAGTWGSMTTRFFGPPFRAAAAEAKAVLVLLAAEALGVPADQLITRDGAVLVRGDESRRVAYGALTKGQRIERHLEVKPTLKDVAAFKIVGKPQLRRDARDKVTGRAHYTGDVRLPGMLYAKVLRPPVHGAKLTSADTTRAKAAAGVRVIEQDGLVAVLHATPDGAEEALALVKAQWELPPASTLTEDTIHDHLDATIKDAKVVDSGGDLAAGRAATKRVIETTFLDGYVAHVCMETHAALAQIEGDKLTVWASTQNPFGVRDMLARTVGFPPEKVRVITPFVGGGFGGKTSNGQCAEAARLARAAGVPVQVMRSREEEFFLDTFRPAAKIKIASGIDDAGAMTFWDYEVIAAGERGSAQFYSVPHHRTVARPSGWTGPAGSHPFATGAWRAPANNTNTFARESQIDIMAAAAGMDPIEFRLKNMTDARMLRTLRAAADAWGWKPAPAPSRRGLGVACGADAGTYVAAIAEVEVDKATGAVKVKRVLVAQDMGVVINPQGTLIQLEGCVMMGLGYALSEEMHFKGGEILDTNFNRYAIPRFSQVPKIEGVLLDHNDLPPQGGGEPAIILMGGLIANAIHDATGARLLRMPMTPARVKAALPRA
ncbi:MAG: xanthine dehydrogenase family protein molybdopterin-binding subunit [Opitutaceae bacterium]|nr:xanthine dehydrogenase family protein molybdopterin-binding subunit [Opitutaceae bacterium]